MPAPRPPVVEMQEDNYFFKLSAFEQRLLDYYDGHPDFVRPVSKRNEALGFIRGGLLDVSITRTSFSWGVPVPWDSGHVFYVWYDALINYLTVAGYGSDEAAFAAALGCRPPPLGQGHPEVPLRLVAGHVHGSRHRSAGRDLRARVPADGRAEARQDDDRGRAGGRRRSAQDHRRLAAGPGRRFRRRSAALPPPAGGPPGRRRGLLLRGHRGPLQLATWPTISATSSRVSPRWSSRSATGSARRRIRRANWRSRRPGSWRR